MRQTVPLPDPSANEPRFVQERQILRFMTCGSVDDGKSTLIGRLLYETKALKDDQVAELELLSRRHGTTGRDLDFSLLMDGLESEREQHITIDVGYRYFASEKRSFVVADTPGHEQYTRNMATGASNADLAVILVDARKGILTQTRRHAFIVSLLGLQHVVLAVNKIDLVGYSQASFARIRDEGRDLLSALEVESVLAIPVSARFGDNIASRSPMTPWYVGPTLLDHLETVQIEDRQRSQPFRMAIQWVNRPDPDFRGYSGSIASGAVRKGDTIIVGNTHRRSTVKSIVTFDGDIPEAIAGDVVTIALEDEIDISRGNVLACEDDPPHWADQFTAHVIWLNDTPLVPGRPYLLKAGPRTVTATATELKFRIDVNSFSHIAAKILDVNEIAEVEFALSECIAFDAYKDNKETGAFIVIDRASRQTVGAGMILRGPGRASNIHWQALDVTKRDRALLKQQRPVALWFTGLSGAGKSTIANMVDRKLHAAGQHSYVLDGDNIRHGLSKDLGFTELDRAENIRRVAEAAKLFVDAGLIVLVSFISPFSVDRQRARELLEYDEFIEIYVDVPLSVAEKRDPKGLYAKARSGRLSNFTGIDSPYQAPEHAELHLDADACSADELADRVIEYLTRQGYL